MKHPSMRETIAVLPRLLSNGSLRKFDLANSRCPAFSAHYSLLPSTRLRLYVKNLVIIASAHHPTQEVPTAPGFNTGRNGVHTSRTMMFAELSTLLQHLPLEAPGAAFEGAVLQENVLGKTTISSRKRTLEHLLLLYGLDPSIPVFRLLRHFWRLDPNGRAQIVLVAARARDPLLDLGTDFILPLSVGERYSRTAFEEFIAERHPSRFSDKMRRSLAQNIASSFTQAAFLIGRAVKIRQQPRPSIGAVAFAIALNKISEVVGVTVWSSPWFRVLGLTAAKGDELAREASRRGWIDYRRAGEVVSLSLRHLGSELRIRELYE